MNRADLHQLAELRIREAQILLNAGSYPGAYYLAGYAVECALKACIARQTKEHDFPEKDRVNKSWTHNLEELLRLAELKDLLAADRKSDIALDRFWDIVVNWDETTRYELAVTQEDARNLYNAVSDPAKGVLPWLKSWW